MAALSLFFPRLTPVFFSFAFLVSLSRYLLCCHYLSDILVGAFIGIAFCCLFYAWWVRQGWLPDHLCLQRWWSSPEAETRWLKWPAASKSVESIHYALKQLWAR